jgi:histidinol phosphatase-like PHP family hydrolase
MGERNEYGFRIECQSAPFGFICGSFAKAQEAGVKFFINTDAHAVDQLRFMEIGVKAARKGWIKRENILNTLDAKQMKRFLQIP